MTARAALLLALGLAGCAMPEPTGWHTPDGAPLTFHVEFAEAPREGVDRLEPAPFSLEATEYEITVEAIGRDREVMTDWSGIVAVRATPGELRSPPNVELSNGTWTGTVEVARAYDELRIWFADEGTADNPGSYATGVTPALYIDRPTVRQVQESDSVVESHFEHEYVPIKGWDGTPGARDLVVTTVLNDGFYVTDLTDPPGSYNSLFVFTFSRPNSVAAGSRLVSLEGIVSEFLGFTEISFPTYEVAPEAGTAPDPYVLDPTIVCDSPDMEKWESSVIRLNDLRSDFASGADCLDYTEHAQWPAVIEGAECGGEPSRISIVNANTVPSFGFPECSLSVPPGPGHDVELDYLIGILRHVRFASPPWILEVRSCLDFPEADRPADCAQLLARPMSGPRVAPASEYRDLVTCEGVPYSLD